MIEGMNMKKIHVLAGGPQAYIPDLKQYEQEDVIWVGVDRGVYLLLKEEISPTIAVGDFDSVTDQEWEFIRNHVKHLKQVQPEKDETDMELALLWAMEQKPSIIRIFAATGGRLDHFLANIFMLTKDVYLSVDTTIEMIDTNNIISVHKPGIYSIEKDDEKKYISFLPMTSTVKGITLRGFKYPLTDRHIERGSTLCISNELIKRNGTFSFEKGILMMIRSKD